MNIMTFVNKSHNMKSELQTHICACSSSLITKAKIIYTNSCLLFIKWINKMESILGILFCFREENRNIVDKMDAPGRQYK